MRHLLLLTALLTGCTTYPTLEEACHEKVPGEKHIGVADNLAAANWMNCYRRQAGLARARVQPQFQTALEAHSDYLTNKQPSVRNLSVLDVQVIGDPDFTGVSPYARAEAAGWYPQDNALFVSMTMADLGLFSGQLSPEVDFDLWFSYPVFRQVFMQNSVLGFGVANTLFPSTIPVLDTFVETDVEVWQWNFLFQQPYTNFAEEAIAFPPNGAADVPSRYVHLVSGPLVAAGVIDLYEETGYPITFTVGLAESNLEVTEAALLGPAGAVPIRVSTATGFQGLGNTAVIIPEDPLEVGQTYICDVELKSNQGVRRARTEFSIGSRALPSVDFQSRSSARGAMRMLQIDESLTFDSDGPLEAR